MNTSQSTNQREFIELYNEVHALLSERLFNETDKFVSFSRCIDELAKRKGNYFLTQHIEELRLINDFRNLIVHKTTNKFYDIAEPSEHIMAILAKVKEILENPIKISSMVEKRKMVTFDIEDPLMEVFKHVAKDDLSQFPIFKGDQLLGMLTDNGITHFIADHIHEPGFLEKEHRLKDIFNSKGKDDYRSAYEILYSERDLDDVVEAFSDLSKDIHYVLITRASKSTIKSRADLIDIFTTADLPEILSILDGEKPASN